MDQSSGEEGELISDPPAAAGGDYGLLRGRLRRPALRRLVLLLLHPQPSEEVVLGRVDEHLAAHLRVPRAAVLRADQVPDVAGVLRAVLAVAVEPLVALALGVRLGRLEPQRDGAAGQR